MFKVVVIGPESTGKTTLCKDLAAYFNTTWVEEYARSYIQELHRPYQPLDLLAIARGQLESESDKASNANQLLICDTNLLVIKVWSEYKYGLCDPLILQWHDQRQYDLYLITDIDIPWEFDPQREHPNNRAELMNIYLQEIAESKIPFFILKGDREARKQLAISHIESLLRNKLNA